MFNLKISWPLDHLYPYDEFDERKTPHFWVIKDFLHSCLLRSGCRSSRFLQMIQAYSVLSVVEQNASGLKGRSTFHIFENDFFVFKELFSEISLLKAKNWIHTYSILSRYIMMVGFLIYCVSLVCVFFCQNNSPLETKYIETLLDVLSTGWVFNR